MSELALLCHIPLLRIDRERLPFREGELWRMPFDMYDWLSLGAFTDHRNAYDKTAPVFYKIDVDLDLPVLRNLQQGQEGANGAHELSVPSNDWSFLNRLGLGFINTFLDHLVDRARAALLLAAPTSALPNPRLSTAFAVSTGDASFALSSVGKLYDIIRVHGDAAQEYLFFAEAAGPPVPSVTIEWASSLVEVVDKVQDYTDLSAALSSLLAATAPSLSLPEQLTLSVITLEALLMPEVRSGLGKSFARRVSALLASSVEHGARLERVARQLYAYRSADLHGEASRAPGQTAETIQQSHAQQLLGASIVALAQKVGGEISLEKLRLSLDADSNSFGATAALVPLSDPPGLCQPERLSQSQPSAADTWSSGADMRAREGYIISHAPIIGLGTDLGTDDSYPLDRKNILRTVAPIIMPYSAMEILSMEEKDIRRDLGTVSIERQPIAGLFSMMETDASDNQAMRYLRRASHETSVLLRSRDLGVIALRLAGFTTFYDPELLGSYVYDESTRYRRPTVLRGSLLKNLMNEPEEHISAVDVETVASAWRLLAAYNASARSPDIDRVLTLFRHALDRLLVPSPARAGLLFGTLEAMLGRFRPWQDDVQLEDLVAKLANADSDAGIWFKEQGRKFRNAVAHGRWDPNQEGTQPLDHLVELLRAIVPVFVSAWLDLDDRTGQRPDRILIDRVTDQVVAEAGS